MARKAVSTGRIVAALKKENDPSTGVDGERGIGNLPSVHPKMGSPAKRTARKWTEEHLLTSDKSVLVGADLVKLLASSAAWNCLEEDEKRQILALLPENTHPTTESSSQDSNEKIPPLPDHFVRYSNNWRSGIRQFQLDLQNGRYDPEWLIQAEDAREERSNGDFDSFKNEEYEKFWGQKQKMDMALACGESGRVKLKDLIADDVIMIGDMWRFSFVFGKGEDRILIDKEVKVHEIHPTKLTFLIPTGQRVFLPSDSTEVQDIKILTRESTNCDGGTNQSEQVTSSPQLDDDNSRGTSKETTEATESCLGSKDKQICVSKEKFRPNDSACVQVLVVNPHENNLAVDIQLKRPVPQPTSEPPPKRKRGRPRRPPLPPLSQDMNVSEAALEQKAPELKAPQQTAPELTVSKSESVKPEFEGPAMMVATVSSPNALVKRILKTDNRRPEGRTGNAWKEIRCIRNNQDMGSLFDVRHTWYLQQQK